MVFDSKMVFNSNITVDLKIVFELKKNDFDLIIKTLMLFGRIKTSTAMKKNVTGKEMDHSVGSNNVRK